MKIQNYLHLYLGCVVVFHEIRKRETLDISLLKQLAGIEHLVKPILRPLSDMTQDEYQWFSDELMVHNINEREMAEEILEGCTPAVLQYALSKGFDLFGLIDAGLAINATKPQKFN